MLDILKLLGSEQSFEDIEPAARVRIDNRRVELARAVESNRAAVAKPHRALLAFLAILRHRSLIRSVIDNGHLDEWQVGHAQLS